MRPTVPAATVWTLMQTQGPIPNTRQCFGGSGLSLRFPAGGAETEGWDRTREQVTRRNGCVEEIWHYATTGDNPN